MALTKELITKNVEGITEEQVNALIKLSDNAFNEAIATRIGEIHGQYDQDIAGVVGQQKPGGVKTYEWLKTVLSDLKTKSEGSEALNAKIADLEAKLKDGKGNEALKQQLADLEAQKNQLQTALQGKESEFAEKLKAEQSKAIQLKVDHEFQKALTGVQFKPEEVMPTEVRDVYINAAKQKVLAGVTPDWIDNGNGGQRLVFRDQNGQVLNNPDNALNPFTASELLTKELTPIIAGRTQPGGGTKPKGGNGGGAFNLNGATTQPQAAKAIQDHILGLGIQNGSVEFQAKFDEAWKDNKVSELPAR
jgi:Skp family chaperone for outer membrane proteins